MSDEPEKLLPREILERAFFRGNEFAWRLSDIPEVIEAARSANLVSIGGQLQFRFSDDAICECYWVEVDTYKSVDPGQSWPDRVSQTADAALTEFRSLGNRFDFLDEGRKAFAQTFEAFEAAGGNAAEAMCFIWYVESELSHPAHPE